MPGRTFPISTNQVYHIFNRGIDRRTTFSTKMEYQRFLQATEFYRFSHPPCKLSEFLRFEDKKQNKLSQELNAGDRRIDIITYCFMPNHYHFLLKQHIDNGISKFISDLQNSYTKYFNAKHERIGPLFLNQFKAVRIETDEQLIHVSRYIHLNPLTGYIVKSSDKLVDYEWSSYKAYLNKGKSNVDTDIIMTNFKSIKSYEKFVSDQEDYQKKLKEIEHLL